MWRYLIMAHVKFVTCEICHKQSSRTTNWRLCSKGGTRQLARDWCWQAARWLLPLLKITFTFWWINVERPNIWSNALRCTDEWPTQNRVHRRITLMTLTLLHYHSCQCRTRRRWSPRLRYHKSANVRWGRRHFPSICKKHYDARAPKLRLLRILSK